ncbi:MAG: hypothetical protein IT379_39510 [Deltaproteobacteria bacterium]|nr:hypothetical protein [Deltaproteobacteria bacterium]
MTQPFLGGLEPEHHPCAELSQWYTAPELARRIVRWSLPAIGMRILEPAAGRGALIDPLVPLLESRAIEVVACELDEANVEVLRARYHGLNVDVRHCDFLATDVGRCDLALQNPPYEDDRDIGFVLHALEHAPRVVALLRSAFRHGARRRNQVWRWAELLRVVELAERPRFEGPVSGSPLSDFAVFELSSRPLPRAPGEADRPKVEWW